MACKLLENRQIHLRLSELTSVISALLTVCSLTLIPFAQFVSTAATPAAVSTLSQTSSSATASDLKRLRSRLVRLGQGLNEVELFSALCDDTAGGSS